MSDSSWTGEGIERLCSRLASAADDCPTDAMLAQFTHDDTTAGGKGIAMHVANCEDCEQIVQLLRQVPVDVEPCPPILMIGDRTIEGVCGAQDESGVSFPISFDELTAAASSATDVTLLLPTGTDLQPDWAAVVRNHPSQLSGTLSFIGAIQRWTVFPESTHGILVRRATSTEFERRETDTNLGESATPRQLPPDGPKIAGRHLAGAFGLRDDAIERGLLERACAWQEHKRQEGLLRAMPLERTGLAAGTATREDCDPNLRVTHSRVLVVKRRIVASIDDPHDEAWTQCRMGFGESLDVRWLHGPRLRVLRTGDLLGSLYVGIPAMEGDLIDDALSSALRWEK